MRELADALPAGFIASTTRASRRSRDYLEQVWGDAAARFRLAAQNTREE